MVEYACPTAALLDSALLLPCWTVPYSSSGSTAPPTISPLQVAFIILASTIPIGMPVVIGAVLAVGAREMVAEKAIVTR